jgi:hypothetical protein
MQVDQEKEGQSGRTQVEKSLERGDWKGDGEEAEWVGGEAGELGEGVMCYENDKESHPHTPVLHAPPTSSPLPAPPAFAPVPATTHYQPPPLPFPLR